ncbi:hypothetical protein ISG33_09275 [Glaciecola sp. MH2013]|uniref:hypothetical protein n=1 Tax=Glaciecola sp. MH2013 TaxID=2785524 RepID=UPI00189F8FA2|nr:hypothetical protein [Glaciecola sp. MH2013]MBF7073583.1 hypothetical protein [Glaciecola sp. MH2013]
MEIVKGLIAGFIVFVGIMLFLGYLPKLISKIYDPPNMKFIKRYFEESGCIDVEITPHSAHYGVRYTKNGNRLYAKCLAKIKEEKIEWVGKKPEWANT